MFVLTLLIFVFSLLYFLLSKRYAYWKKCGVPYPNPVLIFGNTGRAITLQTDMSELCCDIYRKFKGYSYVGFFNMWNPALIIRDPELIKDVLIKQFNNFHDNWIETEHEIDPVLANNPFVLQGDQWKLIRAQLTPQFTSSKIKSIFPQILIGCNNMVEFIKSKTEERISNTFEVKDLSARFTGDNVIRCAYGLEGKSFMVEVPDSFKIGEQISSSSVVIQLKQTIAFYFPVLRKLFKTTFLGDPVPRIFKDIIMEAIKYRDQHNVVRNDYLDFIRELNSKSSELNITDDYLVGHAFTFFLDGFETSSSTLAYALFELSVNLDIQNLARKEIDRVLEKHNNELSYEAAQEMEYIDNVIFETLRKHPIIKILSRVCTEEFTFPSPSECHDGKDVIIKKGTQIFIPVEGVHNNTDFYDNPDKFDPNRFKEEVKSARPKCCFLGFGEGPRICLGRRFALAQVKLAIVAILSEFELKLNANTTLPIQQENLHLFNSPKNGIWLDFCVRSESRLQ